MQSDKLTIHSNIGNDVNAPSRFERLVDLTLNRPKRYGDIMTTVQIPISFSTVK